MTHQNYRHVLFEKENNERTYLEHIQEAEICKGFKLKKLEGKLLIYNGRKEDHNSTINFFFTYIITFLFYKIHNFHTIMFN